MGVMKRMLAMRAGNNGRMSRAKFARTQSSTFNVVDGLPNNQLPELLVDGISEEVLREFMPIFQERLKGNIVTLNIGNEGDLDDSLRVSVSARGKNATGTLRFRFYGRFVDMGVGKGTTLAELQSGRQVSDDRKGLTSRRRPKVWFSKQYAHERARLVEIMTERMQQLATEAATNLPNEVPLTL